MQGHIPRGYAFFLVHSRGKMKNGQSDDTLGPLFFCVKPQWLLQAYEELKAPDVQRVLAGTPYDGHGATTRSVAVPGGEAACAEIQFRQVVIRIEGDLDMVFRVRKYRLQVIERCDALKRGWLEVHHLIRSGRHEGGLLVPVVCCLECELQDVSP